MFGCRVQKITIDAGLTCPNRDGTISTSGCIYCNQRGSGTGAHADGHSIREQLLDGKKRMAARYKAKKFIAYFQSFSNTYAPVEKLERLYDEALSVEGIVGLFIGTRPDCVDSAVLDLLAEYSKKYLIFLEYGLQSAHDRTLQLLNRGHDARCFEKAVNEAHNKDLKICTHVILGLPGETRQHVIETAQFLGNLRVKAVKIHLLYVIKSTKLETYYKKGDYQCMTQQEYVELTCDFLEHLPPQMIIQRLTSDPHPEELVAPLWALRKNETLNRIRKRLEQRETWQGKAISGSGSPYVPDKK
jgi:radical SAM protein (TIGR01212 family)